MFVTWAHYIIPKISFILSYISNPLFIYLIHNNDKVLLGPYRYLLYFFATFNMMASLADLLIPVCVYGYRYAFVTFVVDGPFSSRSQFGENSIAYRCAFISGTYGILNVHFIFRYLILKKNDLVTQYFMPYGLILAVGYVFLHWIAWVVIDITCLYSVPEMRDYIRDSFRELYHVEIDDINLVAGLYSIVTGIQSGLGTMSKKTAQMQKQLFKALTIQTVIPICVSFLPCTCSFYGSALRIDFVNWVYWGATIAVSMFPFLDPMAIIFFLPALRRRLGFKFGRVSGTVSGHEHHVSFDHKPPSEFHYDRQRAESYM